MVCKHAKISNREEMLIGHIYCYVTSCIFVKWVTQVVVIWSSLVDPRWSCKPSSTTFAWERCQQLSTCTTLGGLDCQVRISFSKNELKCSPRVGLFWGTPWTNMRWKSWSCSHQRSTYWENGEAFHFMHKHTLHIFARRVVEALRWECQHPQVPLILRELVLGLDEHERPEMAQESLQLKRRRVELKQLETSLYGKAARLLSVQKTTLGTGSRRPKAWSVFSWHGVSLWRSQRFGGSNGCNLELES